VGVGWGWGGTRIAEEEVEEEEDGVGDVHLAVVVRVGRVGMRGHRMVREEEVAQDGDHIGKVHLAVPVGIAAQDVRRVEVKFYGGALGMAGTTSDQDNRPPSRATYRIGSSAKQEGNAMRTTFFFVIMLCLALPCPPRRRDPIERKRLLLERRADGRADELPADACIEVAGRPASAGRRHRSPRLLRRRRPAYYPVFQEISASEVVVFGVTHRAIREKLGHPQDKLILDSYTEWQGPYGKTRISGLRENIKKSLDSKNIMVDNDAHCMEHSIDSLLPFLQHARRDVRITPSW